MGEVQIVTLKLIGALCVLYALAGVAYWALVETLLLTCIFCKPRKDADTIIFIGWPIYLLTDVILVVLYVIRRWYQAVRLCNARVMRFLR